MDRLIRRISSHSYFLWLDGGGAVLRGLSGRDRRQFGPGGRAETAARGGRRGRPDVYGALPSGPLTRSERALLERWFAVIDTDGNGSWQRDDCTLLTQRLCDAFGLTVGSGPGRAVATGQLGLFEVLLRHMDTDGNQQISRG